MKKIVGILILLASLSMAADQALIDQEITVERSDLKEFHFLVPNDPPNLEFRGEFKCSGGFNDDISVYVMTQQNYVRWFNQYDHKMEAKFNKQKEGKFTVAAKPGETYYFILYNFFSSVSNKKVKFKLKLVPQK